MKTSIKNKLLLFWLSSVFISLLLSGEIYKYMLNSFYENNAKERIETLHQEMLNQKEELQKLTKSTTEQFIKRKDFFNALLQLKNSADSTQKLLIANQIHNFANSANYQNIIVFDQNKEIISYYLSTVSLDARGINQGGEYLDEDMLEFTPQTKQKIQDFFYNHQKNEENAILYKDEQFIVDVTIPVLEGNQILGYVNVEKFISLIDILKLANRTNLQMHVIYKDTCTLNEEEFCKLFESKQMWVKSKNFYLGKKRLSKNIEIVYSLDESLLENGKTFISKSQTIVFFTILPILSLGILIFVKLYIAKPIAVLLSATHKVKEGLAYNDTKSLKGEFRELSKTFESLSHEILHRELELKKKNINLQESIKELEEYTKALNESSIISKGDIDGNITYVNDTLCKKTGYTPEEIIGRPHNIFRHPSTSKEVFKSMWQQLLNKQIWKGVLQNINKAGDSFYVSLIIVPILDAKGEIKEFLALRQDITELIRSQEEIKKLSQTDTLTGLGNRVKLITSILHVNSPALALVNIDSFKEINDFYGLSIGDKTIISLGRRLQSFFNPVSIFRVHADEFAILFDLEKIEYLAAQKVVFEACEQIQKEQFVFDSITLSLNLTIGVSNKKENLLNSADLALKTAKKEKKDILAYDESLKTEEEYKNNILWSAKIKNAIKDDRIVPVFQAIQNNTTQKIEKYEALVRLIDEEGKEISPFFFLDIAKKTKQYATLTQIMIEKSFAVFKNEKASFSINLSINDISDEKTNAYILSMLEKYNFGDRLIFEIVESEGFENFQVVEDFIQNVKSYGAKISIDDFGTGYSNFEYLMKLKADFIKIDGSLIKNIDTDTNAFAVVETIVMFAKKNNLLTVAEFVSSKSIYDKVCELGIDYSQGFYIQKPQRDLEGV